MLLLNRKNLLNRDAWRSLGVKLPSFDVQALCGETRAHPRWVHAGPGNIFRGYIAALGQQTVERGGMTSGITALSTFDHQIMERIYRPCDNLALQVVMHADGRLDRTVIASIGEALRADAACPGQWERCKEVLASPGLQMFSFTITEKGYNLRGMDGAYLPDVEEDFETGAGGQVPKNGMAVVAALLLVRYRAGGHPIALVSMDNFSHNGDKLRDSVRTIAAQWVERGSAPAGFLAYLDDGQRVSFPCSCIDKITPRPDPAVSQSLRESGFGSTELVVTDQNTYIAPFVNTEAPQYLVIEDRFPNGRPPLEQAGVWFVDRGTVDDFERMKVCTCLNPLHTALAVLGCLLGHTSIAAEMQDETLVRLVRRIGYDEGLPVVVNPGIVEPLEFLDEVMKVRLPNPYIPDTPQRIATDTSQKLGIRYGETIKLYRSRDDLDTASLRAIPLAIAGWCRYLLGLDDGGKAMEPSPDPLLDQLQACLSGVRLGEPHTAGGCLRPILSNAQIFGCNLYEDGLGTRVEDYFARMLAGPGAVRTTLKEVLEG